MRKYKPFFQDVQSTFFYINIPWRISIFLKANIDEGFLLLAEPRLKTDSTQLKAKTVGDITCCLLKASFVSVYLLSQRHPVDLNDLITVFFHVNNGSSLTARQLVRLILSLHSKGSLIS